MAEENDDDDEEEEERKRTEEGGKKGFKLGREVGKELRSFPFNLKGGEDVGSNVPSALKVSFQHVKKPFSENLEEPEYELLVHGLWSRAFRNFFQGKFFFHPLHLCGTSAT